MPMDGVLSGEDLGLSDRCCHTKHRIFLEVAMELERVLFSSFSCDPSKKLSAASVSSGVLVARAPHQVNHSVVRIGVGER